MSNGGKRRVTRRLITCGVRLSVAEARDLRRAAVTVDRPLAAWIRILALAEARALHARREPIATTKGR